MSGERIRNVASIGAPLVLCMYYLYTEYRNLRSGRQQAAGHLKKLKACRSELKDQPPVSSTTTTGHWPTEVIRCGVAACLPSPSATAGCRQARWPVSLTGLECRSIDRSLAEHVGHTMKNLQGAQRGGIHLLRRSQAISPSTVVQHFQQ